MEYEISTEYGTKPHLSPLHIAKYKGRKPDYRDKLTNKLIFFVALPLMFIVYFLLYDIPTARYYALTSILYKLIGLEVEYYPVWRTIVFVKDRYHLYKLVQYRRLVYSQFRNRVKKGQVDRFESEARKVVE